MSREVTQVSEQEKQVQYEYIEKTFNLSKNIIINYYFNEIKSRVKEINNKEIKNSYKKFL